MEHNGKKIGCGCDFCQACVALIKLMDNPMERLKLVSDVEVQQHLEQFYGCSKWSDMSQEAKLVFAAKHAQFWSNQQKTIRKLDASKIANILVTPQQQERAKKAHLN